MLDLQNINKDYGEGKFAVPVLFDITLQVEEGEYVAIMGPSGSGKSTLMNIIGCLDTPTSGNYYFDGESVPDKNDDQLSDLRNRSIGFVFQNFNLLPRETALKNVELPMVYAKIPSAERTRRAKEALERVGLGDRMDFYPTQLSGGQKQRVAIARAMVMKPRLLLADEPTGALDTASGEQVMDIFQELSDEGVTIVMITHERDIAEHARRKLFIRDGRLSTLEDELKKAGEGDE
ncbi:MAG: ABC transporter ATP-binding protein [Lachnospiraceae bacterium]|nr:ABC transporter ATP-binding protein [Lachnospiraceae bacterium]